MPSFFFEWWFVFTCAAIGGALAAWWVFGRSGESETNRPTTQPYQEPSVAGETAADTTTSATSQPAVQTWGRWGERIWITVIDLAIFLIFLALVSLGSWFFSIWPFGSEVEETVVRSTAKKMAHPEGPNFWSDTWNQSWSIIERVPEWFLANNVGWLLLVASALAATLLTIVYLKTKWVALWAPVALVLWFFVGPSVVSSAYNAYEQWRNGPVTSDECPGLLGNGRPFLLTAERGWWRVNDGSCRVIHDVVAGEVDFDTSDGPKTFGVEDGIINGYTYAVKAHHWNRPAQVIISLCPLSTVGHMVNLDCSRAQS